jgi:hypothetical protein
MWEFIHKLNDCQLPENSLCHANAPYVVMNFYFVMNSYVSRKVVGFWNKG